MCFRRIFLVLICFFAASTCLFAGKKDVKKEKEPAEPEGYHAVEVADLFSERILSVCTTAELRALEKEVSKKNASLSGAYRAASKEWTESEKLRVEAGTSKKKKGDKDPPRLVRKPFVIDQPGLISMKVEGPYADKAEAEAQVAERAAEITKDQDFQAGSDEQRRELMSAQMLASYEANLKLEETQQALFLAKLEALNGKSSLLSGIGVKRMGGKIEPLVKNTHRMMKPGANAGTATKVDPAAVMK